MVHLGNAPKMAIIALLLVSFGLGAVSCGKCRCGSLQDLMRETPARADSLVYWNTKAMADDGDLHQLLDKWKAGNETRLADFALRSDRANSVLEFWADEQRVLIIRGDFDLNEVRQELEALDYDDKDYKLVEVWESANGQDWLAMTDESIIAGAKELVKESISVIKGESPLYDDPDARDVTNRLPSGLLSHFDKYAAEPPYAGLLASGDSFEKKDRETLKVKLVYKFADPDEAAGALEGISEDVDEDYDKIDARQDGRFVIVTGEVEIEDLL